MPKTGRRRRSRAKADHENLERWLLTYADMITLLMAFFIMLYAMSVVNMEKFNQLAVSVRSGFGGDEPELMYDTLGVFDADEASVSSTGGPGLAEGLGLMKQVASAISSKLSPGDRGGLKYYASGGNVTIRACSAAVLFARGSADLTPAAKRTLRAVGEGLQGLTGRVRVGGHTCNLPIHGRFENNWELSAQRAVSVVLYLIGTGSVSAQRLSAMGYADSAPIVPNTCEANRALNRRIDIVLEQPEGGPVSATGMGEDPGQARPEAVNARGADLAAPVDLTQVGGNRP
jgi:chemotaxis protein MotB